MMSIYTEAVKKVIDNKKIITYDGIKYFVDNRQSTRKTSSGRLLRFGMPSVKVKGI